jgi:Tol biopolymer transport system component
MTGASEKPRNPYVGPRAFEEDESQLFFGRDAEIEILTGLVMARRAALLFAPSGAGKSSLLKAGLIPELTRQETVGRGRRARTYQKMRVLPILTVGGAIPAGMRQPIANVYVFRALLSLQRDADPEDLASQTLVEALAPSFGQLEPDGQFPEASISPPATLLIFDQFEEIFTHDPTRRQEREGFFRQVNQALAVYPTLHVLFSMREDYIAELTPYTVLLPEQLRPRFRLEFLGERAALLAIQQPASLAGVEFTDAAAATLALDLRRVRVQCLDGTMEEQGGDYVEPVQLQVVCHRLWQKLPLGATQVVEADVEAVGDVDSALAGYYADRVAAIAAETSVSERAIRDWCDRHLITEQGIRGQVLQGQGESQGLANDAIWPLVDAHLVRAEKRRGATWFELAHDRLIEPVRVDNAAWREANLSPLQRQADLWEEQGRPESLLLRSQALAEAKKWAGAHRYELTHLEEEFIDESAKAGRLQSAKRLRVLLLGAAVVVALLATLSILAFLSREEAIRQKETALSAQNEADRSRDQAWAAGTAEAKSGQTAVAALAAAESGLSSALAERVNSQDQLVTIQALQATNQALSTRLTPAPTRTPLPTATPTTESGTPRPTSLPTSTATPTNIPTPTPDQEATAAAEAATAQVLQEQLSQVWAAQTAAVQALTPTPTPSVPGHLQIAFVSSRRGGSDLFLMSANGEGEGGERPARWIPLRPCDQFFSGCFRAGSIDFEPGGERFVFHAQMPQPGTTVQSFDLFLAELRTDEAWVQQNLTLTEEKGYWARGAQGTWSPTGNQIAYLTTIEDRNRVRIMNDDGGGQRDLTSGLDYKDEQPAWSPDAGKWIAVAAQSEGSEAWEIFVVSPSDGRKRVQVTESGKLNRAPAWSPDGQQLAFARGQKQPEDICVINLDGTGERCYKTRWTEDMPAWSPDGNWIVFHRYVDNTYRTEIILLRADFGEEYQLTYNKADDWGAVWVP